VASDLGQAQYARNNSVDSTTDEPPADKPLRKSTAAAPPARPPIAKINPPREPGQK
jgi:hypothetical protein